MSNDIDVDVEKLNSGTASLMMALIDAYEKEGKDTKLTGHETCLVTLTAVLLFSARMLSLLPAMGLTSDNNYLDTTVDMFRKALAEELKNRDDKKSH